MTVDGAAAVEILRAELARAKEQARINNAAAEKASAELKAQQAARHQCEEKISSLTLELKEAVSHCRVLERIIKPKRLILTRPYERRKKCGPNLERLGRRSDKLGRSRLVSPFYCKLSSVIRVMLSLTKCGALQTCFWTCRRALPMWRSFIKRKRDMQRRSFFAHSLVHQTHYAAE